jgi:uncharacterized protein
MNTFFSIASVLEHTQWVLGGALLIGIALGAVMQASHVCSMGALSDAVLFGSFARLKTLALALAVAILGTQTLAAFEVIDISKSIFGAYASGSRLFWLSHIIGGLCFGVGMVLAGGCASRALLRIGGGSLKAFSVWLVMALSAAMTLRGLFSSVRIHVFEAFSALTWTAPHLDFPSLINVSPMLCSAVVASSLSVWSLYKAADRTVASILSGLLIGCLVVAMWYLSGVVGYVSEHPDTLQEAFLASHSGRMESFSFVAPASSWLNYALLFSDKSQTLNIGMMLSIGMVLGAFMVAYRRKTFAWESFASSHAGTRDWLLHMLGAILMGFGGVLGIGCSISQGLGGLSTLAVGSMLTVSAIVVGAVLTLKNL